MPPPVLARGLRSALRSPARIGAESPGWLFRSSWAASLPDACSRPAGRDTELWPSAFYSSTLFTKQSTLKAASLPRCPQGGPQDGR